MSTLLFRASCSRWLALALAVGCGSASSGADSSATGQGGAPQGGAGGGAGSGGQGSEPLSCAPRFDGDAARLAVGASLEAGAESTLCLRWTTPDDLDITSFVGTLGGAAGHHALLLVHTTPSAPDGVAPCSEPELMDAAAVGEFQVLAGVSYESDGVPVSFPSNPVQVGLRVPAGAQLILDAHFLETFGAPTEACASLELVTGAPVVAPLELRTLLPTEQYGLVVPAAGSIDVSYAIEATDDVRVAAASTHMHDGGTHAKLSVDESGLVLHETFDWSEPDTTLHQGIPAVVKAGQTYRLECSFVNPGPLDHHFPDQMCVGGMYVLPCTFPGACP